MSDVVVNIITPLSAPVQIAAEILGLKKETRVAWTAPYSYVGKANKGTGEEESNWKIYRIECFGNGTTEVKTAVSVKWTERLTITYN